MAKTVVEVPVIVPAPAPIPSCRGFRPSSVPNCVLDPELLPELPA